jgi:hypothetical protein
VILRHDDVIVVRLTAEIRGRIRGLRAFLAFVEAPIQAIEVEMIVPGARIGLARFALEVATELLPDKRVLLARIEGLQAPGIVLRGAQVDVLEFLRALGVEQRVLKRRRPVVAAEEQAEECLGLCRG